MKKQLDNHDIKEISEFIQNNWVECASVTCAGQRLKMLYNGNGQIKVTYNGKELYRGSDIIRSAEAFNKQATLN
jgi:hypothetical protein